MCKLLHSKLYVCVQWLLAVLKRAVVMVVIVWRGVCTVSEHLSCLLSRQQAQAEQEEEFISNTLLKKINLLKKEKETLALNYEQEEEFLTNDLSRKLTKVGERPAIYNARGGTGHYWCSWRVGQESSFCSVRVQRFVRYVYVQYMYMLKSRSTFTNPLSSAPLLSVLCVLTRIWVCIECVLLCVLICFCYCWFGHLAASRESAAGTATGAGTGTPSEERSGPTCVHSHLFTDASTSPTPHPLQVSKLMKKIDRLEKEVTAKQDILEQVSSRKDTCALCTTPCQSAVRSK